MCDLKQRETATTVIEILYILFLSLNFKNYCDLSRTTVYGGKHSRHVAPPTGLLKRQQSTNTYSL